MKRIITIILAALLIAAVFAGCGEEAQKTELHPARIDPGKITFINASDAIFSSYLYVIEDETAIWELVDLYNDLTFEELAEGEEAPDLLSGTLYSLTFYEGNGDEDPENYASVAISPQGYLLFPLQDYGHAYRLLSDFDEAHVKKLLEDYNTFV